MSTFAIDLLSGNPILLNKDIIDLSGATIQYADYLPLSGGTLTGNVEYEYTSNQLFLDIDNNVVGGIGITPQFSENSLTDEMVFVADDFAENGLNLLGVRVKGAYTTLSSKKLNLGVQGAQVGSRLVATSIDSNGEVEVGWETPQTPDYSTDISNSVDLLIGTGSAPTPWVALTQPLTINRDVASTKGTFYFEILVENSSNKSGVFELSWGKNSSLPSLGIATFQIPANFKSIITWTYTNGDIISGDTITPYGRILASSNSLFTLNAVNSERPTTLRFNVNLNGNTNLSQTITPNNITINSDTGTDVILSGATSGSSGLMTANDKINSDNLIGLSGSSYVKNISSISGDTLTQALNNINNKISNIDNTSDLDKPVSNASRAILDGLDGNGVVSGMSMTINSDNTKFNINPGLYHRILDGDIIFNGVSGITPTYLNTNNATYIALNLTGGTVQQPTNFTKKQRRTHIILGTVVHSNKTNINVINNTPDVAISLLSQFNDYIDVMGVMNDGDGNIFSANGTNLFLNKSNGYITKRGVNFTIDVDNPLSINTPALIAPSNIRHRLSNGTEYPDTNSVELFYESSLGVRTALGNNDYVIHRIYLFPSNLIRIQLGQNIYIILWLLPNKH